MGLRELKMPRFRGFIIFTIALALLSTAAVPKAPHHKHSNAAEKSAAGKSIQSLDVFVEGRNLHLLVGGYDERKKATSFHYLFSPNGGLTWPKEVKIRSKKGAKPLRPQCGRDAQIAAANGTVIAAWTAEGDGFMNSGPLVTAVSRNGGKKWKQGPNPADDESNEGHSYIDIQTDQDGNFHLVWLDGRSGKQGLQSATLLSAEVNEWLPNVTVDSQTCECCWNRLIVSPEGELYTLYRDKDPRDMALASSRNVGRSWKRLSTVGEFDWQFEGCPHVGGGLAIAPKNSWVNDKPRIYSLVWSGEEEHAGLHFFVSKDGGKTWGSEKQLGDKTAKHADLAVSENGIITAVWDSFQDGQKVIWVSRATKGGKDWSEPLIFSDPENFATHPKVVATPFGIRVFWTEKDKDSNSYAWKMGII